MTLSLSCKTSKKSKNTTSASSSSNDNDNFKKQAIIKKRQNIRSLRRKDGLITCAKNNTSQNGEDGIIQKLFEILQQTSKKSYDENYYYTCVDIGAWDGKHLSNTYSLLHNTSANEWRWKGVLIEANVDRYHELCALYSTQENVKCMNALVSSDPNSSHSLTNLLNNENAVPEKIIDFLTIDVDGIDYWILHDILIKKVYTPTVICIEFNPTIPNDLIYIQPQNDAIRHGSSLAALVELANEFNYTLVETTLFNAFFIPKQYYIDYFQDLIPDTSIEALSEISMGTQLYQLYDGTLKLHGCKKLLWHKVPIHEEKLQVISHSDRSFPFAPEANITPSYSNELFCNYQNVVEINPEKEISQEAITKLLQNLKQVGFSYVQVQSSSSSHSSTIFREALKATKLLLHDASEEVRRSCLSKVDRARRGYSPMNTENFASLLGNSNVRNDLVRKFRMGNEESVHTQDTHSSNSLFKPNIWPSSDIWNVENTVYFKDTVETCYNELCNIAKLLLKIIYKGLLDEYPACQKTVQPLLESLEKDQNSNYHYSSILTLLSYQRGSRHATKKKGPLVAPHTDVGVITILFFDQGDVATLQRQATDFDAPQKDWINVTLPSYDNCKQQNHFMFVLNIGDCLAQIISQSYLPSTLHQVIPNMQGYKPRNCCALFVGLDANAELVLTDDNDQDTTITYETWRKHRIAKAMKVLN